MEGILERHINGNGYNGGGLYRSVCYSYCIRGGKMKNTRIRITKSTLCALDENIFELLKKIAIADGRNMKFQIEWLIARRAEELNITLDMEESK